MAGRKLIEGSLSESDIEFFRRELKSREPSQLTLITGTGDEAQKVLRDMIDAGASIQDAKLSEKHEAAVDGSKMKIEQSIRIEESIAQGSAMPGMTLRAKRGQMKRQTDRKELIDLTIGDDMEEFDSVKEVKRVIDTSDLKNHIDETFRGTDFSVKEFPTENYPKNSQAYLIEAEFYCRKAREYKTKELAAAAQSQSYIDRRIGREANIMEQYEQVSEMYQKVEKSYSEVFSYCIQEAVYWKIKAEIYNNSEQDKKRMQDPTKSNSCKIHSENDVTKYVYIPTDKKNIDKDNFDLELTKVGFGARNGVDNVMLVVKAIEECKELNTLDMIERLSFYGGEFKDRGMVMVTEERRLIDDDQPDDFPEIEEKYFKNEARSEEYSDIFKILTNENRVFSFDKKGIDEPRRRSQMGEFFNQEGEDKRSIDNFRKIENSSKIVKRATEGVRYTSKLTQAGMNVYRNMYTATKGLDIQDKKMIVQVVTNQFWEARGNVDKLIIEEGRYIEGRRRIETGRRHGIQMERQRVEQVETNRRIEEERRHNFEIEMERQKVEQTEANRRIEEERRRNLEIEMERQRAEQAEANRRLAEERRNFAIEMEKRRLEKVERDRRREEEREREREREKRENERKLRQEIGSRSEELKRIRRNGEAQLREIKEWLDRCEEKDHPRYLDIKRRNEELVNMLQQPLSDDYNLERKLRKLNELIVEEATWNMNVRGLHRDQVGAEAFILSLAVGAVAVVAVPVVVAGAVVVKGAELVGTGVVKTAEFINRNKKPISVGGGAAGGAAIGSLAGPPGALVGAAVGATVGFFVSKLKWW